MANFSVNQVLQLYVAKGSYVDGTTVTSFTNVGDIKVVKPAGLNEMWLQYKGAAGMLKSDTIQLKNLDRIETFSASKMATKMKKVEITLDSSVNSGAPIAGQDYVLPIVFRNFFSSGDASQYFKDAAVHATSDMTASAFYKAMVDSLNKAFAREDGATATSNPYLTFSWKPNGTTATQADAIVIEEKPQAWELGTKKARRVMFDVLESTVFDGTEDVAWNTVTEVTSGLTTVGNGQKIADLEWFAMGERGDQYRGMGWPNVIKTNYLVDPDTNYHVVEIHYAFTDSGVNSYRTEKDMTIVFPATTPGLAAANAFIGALETATGLTIAEVSNS